MRVFGSAAVAAFIVSAVPAVAATPFGVAAAQIAPSDAAAIRSLITLIYGRYHHNREDQVAESRIFTSSTRALAAENTRLLKGEEGDIGADIFLDAQDHGVVAVTSLTLAKRPDRMVAATVVFNDAENRVRGHAKRMVVERTPAGWRVFDVSLPAQGSYRAVMERENAQLRGTSSARSAVAPTASQRGPGPAVVRGVPQGSTSPEYSYAPHDDLLIGRNVFDIHGDIYGEPGAAPRPLRKPR